MPLPALERFANDFATTLAEDLDASETAVDVAAAAPALLQVSGQFRVKVDDEYMIVTAGAATTTWTVTRGAEGSTAATHSNGAAVTHVVTQGALVNHAPHADMQRRLWMPDGAIAEAGGGRATALSSVSVLASGRLHLGAMMVLPAGVEVNAITVSAGSGSANTPLNQWFALVRVGDFAVLRKTDDDTTAAWAISTLKTLSLSSPYTPTVDELVYIGVMVRATTAPPLVGWTLLTAGIGGIAPSLGGASTTGLTDPASLGGTATSPTASNFAFWGYVS